MSKTIVCPKCNSQIIWNGNDAVIECQRCRTKYKMHPQKKAEPVFMPPLGRGQTDYLTVPTDRIMSNKALLKTYIPKGWRYMCNIDNSRFDLISNPFVITITFIAPDNSAKIVFTGESFYKHIDYTPQTAFLQNMLDDRTVSRSPSFFRLKSYMTASEYCDELARTCGLNGLRLLEEKSVDANKKAALQELSNRFLSKGFLEAVPEWAGRTYGGKTPSGGNMKVYTETMSVELMKISTVSSMQMQPVGGMFGMRMMPQMVNQQIQEYFWDTQYEFTLLSGASVFEKSYAELKMIMNTIGYLPGMNQALSEAMSLANSTVMNIAQAQAISLEKQSQIIANTNEYTSNIQHQIIENNAASHDKSASLNSQMINEVNIFTGSSGKVQASTMYDHVYQNVNDPDIYAVQRGDAFELGVELKKKKKTDY